MTRARWKRPSSGGPWNRGRALAPHGAERIRARLAPASRAVGSSQTPPRSRLERAHTAETSSCRPPKRGPCSRTPPRCHENAVCGSRNIRTGRRTAPTPSLRGNAETGTSGTKASRLSLQPSDLHFCESPKTVAAERPKRTAPSRARHSHKLRFRGTKSQNRSQGQVRTPSCAEPGAQPTRRRRTRGADAFLCGARAPVSKKGHGESPWPLVRELTPCLAKRVPERDATRGPR